MGERMVIVVQRSRRPWRRQRWYHRIIARNGEVVSTGELVANRVDAIQTAIAIRDADMVVDASWP